MAEENKTPADQLLDLFVFAPLGLALTARDHLPEIIERGRGEAAQQLTRAKVMGHLAMRDAEAEIRKRIDSVTPRSPSPAAAPPAVSAAATNGKASIREERPARPREAEPKPSSDHLAIPGYDTLSASQVVQRLPGLSLEELAEVRTYEEATRGRRTILSKIGQLQAESS